MRRPTIKRMGLAGRPLSAQYSPLKAFSKVSHWIWLASKNRGCLGFRVSLDEKNKLP